MKKTVLYGFLRWTVLAGFAVLLVFFAGKNRISRASLPEVAAAVEASVEFHNVTEGSDSMVKRLYDIDPAAYASVRLLYLSSNMDADELLIVKLADVSQQREVRAAMEKRLATQKKSFDGYGTFQYALLCDHAEIVLRGNYAIFVVNDHSADAVTAFEKSL